MRVNFRYSREQQDIGAEIAEREAEQARAALEAPKPVDPEDHQKKLEEIDQQIVKLQNERETVETEKLRAEEEAAKAKAEAELTKE